jgi:hypothetical protein
MSDREILDLLAADAPTPPSGHVDGVLAQARRARFRQRLAGWGAGLGVVAVTLGVVAALAPTVGREGTPPAAAASGSSGATASGAGQKPGDPAAGEAGAYAVAIEALAEEVREGASPWPVLYVLDHTCANVVTPTEGECAAQPLPAALRDQLATALAAYAPVRFVAGSAELFDAEERLAGNGGALVTLGRTTINADAAQVPLSVLAGGTNGRGTTYRMIRQDRAWRIVAKVGPEWIT